MPDTPRVLRRSVFAVVAMTTLSSLVGFTAAARPLVPGDRVGNMLFVRGTAATADLKLFDICDPVILRTGRYVRSCGSVPGVKRLSLAIACSQHRVPSTASGSRRRGQPGLMDAESNCGRSELLIARCTDSLQRVRRT